MANMSYCRFVNTATDVRDCIEHWEDDLSESEAKERARLLKMCCRIASEYGGMVSEEELT